MNEKFILGIHLQIAGCAMPKVNNRGKGDRQKFYDAENLAKDRHEMTMERINAIGKQRELEKTRRYHQAMAEIAPEFPQENELIATRKSWQDSVAELDKEIEQLAAQDALKRQQVKSLQEKEGRAKNSYLWIRPDVEQRLEREKHVKWWNSLKPSQQWVIKTISADVNDDD